jgi:phosphoadenosine phosphosulfate reductase
VRKTTDIDFDRISAELGRDPERLTQWALGLGKNAFCSTSFGPFSAVTLHMTTRLKADIPVIWIDAGYGTPATYRFADDLIRRLGLNIRNVRPRRSRAHREAVDGPTPLPDDPRHAAFTEEVKLEPFDRSVKEIGGEVWITGIRAEETEERAAMQPVSVARDGLIKVAPLLPWTARQMNDYLKRHGLPNNFDYYDPTKVEDKRECGLHGGP